MRKLHFIFFLAAMVFAGGCSKQELAPVSDAGTRVFKVSFEQGSRTSLDGLSVYWSENDKVAVADAAGKTEVVTVDSKYAGSSSAELVTTTLGDGPYTLFYPGDLYVPETGSFSLPSGQQYTEGSFANNFSVLAGKGESTFILLKHLSSFIELNFDEPVYGVMLSSVAGEILSGEFKFDGASMKTLSGPDAIHVSGIPEAGITQAILAIPSGEYAKGIAVKVLAGKEDAQWKMATAYSSGLAAIAGNILRMPAIEVAKLARTTGENMIYNAEELQSFLSSAASKAADEVWCLGDDIDLTGVTLSPASDFKGTFNGNGYVIKNWKVATPLFTVNNGTLKNIVIDASCALDPSMTPTSYFGLVVSNNKGKVSGCVNNADINWTGTLTSTATQYFGGIIGYSASPIDKCVNNGNMTINLNSAASTVYYGGVTARIGSSTLSDCVNNGDITVNFVKAIGKNIYYGGVTPVCNSTCQVSGCRNTGDVTFTTPNGTAAVTMAGVVGYMGGGSIKDSENTGNISYLSKDGIKGSIVGGVCGYNAGDISTSRNSGDVTISGTAFRGRNSIGNVDGKITKSTTTILEGGVVAIGCPASASSFKFNMHDCTNTGKVTLALSKMNSSASLSDAGRICVGGLVGDASGPIFTSNNSGPVDVRLAADGSYTAASGGYTSYIGGVAGANYFSTVQCELSISDCSNSGDIYYKTDNLQSTFNMVGGIVGFPGLSGNSCTSVTRNCVNTGNLTVEGTPQVELGGIHGAPGRMENCRNEGEIVGNTSTNRIVIGGIAGFHTNAFEIKSCINTGNVSTTNELSNSGIGALVGLLGNSVNTSGEGCVLNCKISCPETTSKGMVVGLFNGTSNPVTLGSLENPISVKGSVIAGGVETVLTNANYRSWICGNSYTEGTHVINTTFGDPVIPEPEDTELNGTTILKTTTLYGLITDKQSGKGIAGVPVTDGYTFVETDENGVYQMVADYRCRCVSVSVPADYAIPMDETTHAPAFYSNDIQSGVISRRDFTLEAITPTNEFAIAGIGDMHVGRNSGSSSSDWVATSSQRFKNVLLKDVCDHFVSEGVENAFAFTVGDESNSNNNNQWPSIVSSSRNIQMSGDSYLPVFHCMGNHDHMGNCGTTETDFFVNQRIRFIQNLGPADYSLNIGKAHIVVFDNAAYNGATAYRIYDDSWKWFLDDMSHVADKSDKLLIVVMHCPLRGGESLDGSSSFVDHRADLLNQMKAFHQAHILVGHTHRTQEWVHDVKSAGGYPIYEHIHGMAGGTYWRYTNCPDGSPYGYNVYKITGNEVVDHYLKPCGMSKDFQMRVYNGSQDITLNGVTSHWYSATNSLTASSGTSYNAQGNACLEGAFVVSAWHSDPVNWTFELWQNGSKVGELQQITTICDVMNAAYTYDDGDGNGDQVCKDTRHFYYIAAPSGNPATETNWTIKAIQKVPSSKNVTHTYECSQLTTAYDNFLWK